MSQFPINASDTSPDAASSQIVPDAVLDLRGTPCPINFVRTKLKLQQMDAGTLLEVWLDPGEPMLQVPHSLAIEGYGIEQSLDQGSYYALQVRNAIA